MENDKDLENNKDLENDKDRASNKDRQNHKDREHNKDRDKYEHTRAQVSSDVEVALRTAEKIITTKTSKFYIHLFF